MFLKGCFSWNFCDVNDRLQIGTAGYLACSDGAFIKRPFYRGYGGFGLNDVYEMVVDWNLDYLKRNLPQILNSSFVHIEDICGAKLEILKKYIEYDFDEDKTQGYVDATEDIKGTSIVKEGKREMGNGNMVVL